ncbi:MAG: glycosyltransferase [Anaerolineales bacterium]
MRPFLSEGEFLQYQRDRRSHWNDVARRFKGSRRAASYYHRRLQEIFGFLIPPGQRVLEIGCGDGDLIASLEPEFGLGVDFSSEMVQRASRKHQRLAFIQADAHSLPLNVSFDFVILSDLLNDVWDVQAVLEEVVRVSEAHTRVIITSHNRMWEPLLSVADRLNLAKPNLRQNWLTVEDLDNLLHLAGMELIHTWPEILWPLGTPLLAPFSNRFLSRFWPFTHLALTHVLVARTRTRKVDPAMDSISIVVPARNEAGNIVPLLDRLPEFNQPAEVIFVEGHSRDDTYSAIEDAIADETALKCKLIQQQGEGKGDAVREGFKQAEGDILVILDADLSVPPEDLPRFIEALTSGKAEFANGVRLVYPMQDEAMRFANLIGNKFFSLAFSWVLGQPVKDTLCGTKAIRREDYEKIAANREYFGKLDPFGDFDLLLGAAKRNLKIVDVPIRYRSRTYGSTNISRWRHGLLLFRMLSTAARKLKFV